MTGDAPFARKTRRGGALYGRENARADALASALMTEPVPFTDADWYLDPGLGQDPRPYYAALLGRECPVAREPFHGAVAVAGYEEVVAVYNDTVSYSNCNSMAGPFATLPQLPAGLDDISDIVEAAREQMPMHQHL